MEAESEENEKSNEAASARQTDTARTPSSASNEHSSSELNAPQWSVVSFETCLASNLTYDIALKKLKRFKTKKIAGLCIITDEAAERIAS